MVSAFLLFATIGVSIDKLVNLPQFLHPGESRNDKQIQRTIYYILQNDQIIIKKQPPHKPPITVFFPLPMGICS